MEQMLETPGSKCKLKNENDKEKNWNKHFHFFLSNINSKHDFVTLGEGGCLLLVSHGVQQGKGWPDGGERGISQV